MSLMAFISILDQILNSIIIQFLLVAPRLPELPGKPMLLTASKLQYMLI